MTTTASRLKGLVYLVVLLALVAGIPTVLYLLQGNPLAPLFSLASADGIGDLLFTRDDGTLFLSALTLVGWVAWATFTYSIGLEVLAAARGARPRSIKGLGLQQRSAAVLVGGALMLITAGTATAEPIADISHVTSTPAHTAPVSPTAPAKTTAPSWTKAPAQTPPGDTITTVRGDTLWSLAEQHLGDGTRYPEIRNLNLDKIGDDNWLHPGWTLTLPAEAPALVSGAYTVQSGDTLWDIAAQHLGDGSQWPQIRDATGPLTGDLITVGQQLYLSPAAHPGPTTSVPEALPAPDVAPSEESVSDAAPAPEAVPDVEPVPEADQNTEVAPAPESGEPSEVAPSEVAPAPESVAPTEVAPASPVIPTPAPEVTEGPDTPSSIPEQAPAPTDPENTPTEPETEPAPAELPSDPSPQSDETTSTPDSSVNDQSATPPLAAQDVPELPEMVPGGDEMSQAEAQAAAEAAARVFGMVVDANGNFVPAEQADSAPAAVPDVPASVPDVAEERTEPVPEPESEGANDSPPSESAPSATEVVPEPEPEPVPVPEMPSSESDNSTANQQYSAPENAPEMAPEAAPGNVPAEATPESAQEPDESPTSASERNLPPTQIPLDTSVPPAPENAAQTTDLQAEDQGIASSTLLGVSGLAAVALLAALSTYRRRQHHRRQRGERIPLPTGPATETEEVIRASADPAILDTLDVALRHIAAHSRTTEQPLPALLGVFLHEESIELALLDDIDLPTPWIRTSDTNAWSIPLNRKIDAPTTAVSPYPALVELGDLPDGTRILLNLEQLGHLGVAATPQTALDINRALAVFLAFSPLADNLNVTLVGFCEDLPPLVDTGHLTYANDADQVLARLARTTATDAETLHSAGIESMSAARTVYDDSEMTTPEIVLLADPLTDDQKQVFAEILDKAPRIAVAAVTATGDTTPDWTLTATDDHHGELARRAGTIFDLKPTKLTEADYEALVDLLDTAHAQPQPTLSSLSDMWTAEILDLNIDEADTIDDVLKTPTTPSIATTETPHELEAAATHHTDTSLTSVPPTPEPEVDIGHIWIHLLGTPTITPLNGTDAPSGRAPSLTELAALLATHPGIVNHDLDAKIWPRDPLDKAPLTEQPKKKAVRRQNNLSRLRSWLGETETGELAFPKSGDRTGKSGYRLHADVQTDWDIWNHLINGHPTTATDTQLTTATTLITGQPFTSPDPTKYVWAEYLQQEMIAATTDAIEELASRHLHHTSDARTAYELASRGLTIDPSHEGLWRIAILASHARSDINTTQQLIDDLLTELTALEVEPEEETTALLRLLADFHTTTGDTPYTISKAS